MSEQMQANVPPEIAATELPPPLKAALSALKAGGVGKASTLFDEQSEAFSLICKSLVLRIGKLEAELNKLKNTIASDEKAEKPKIRTQPGKKARQPTPKQH